MFGLDHVSLGKAFLYLARGLFVLAVVAIVGAAVWSWRTASIDARAARRRDRANNLDVDEPVTLWLFHANDWCDACQAAKPGWEAFRDLYHGKTLYGRAVTCRETDCSHVRRDRAVAALLTQHRVTHFPTVLLLHRQHETTMHGAVTLEHLKETVRLMGQFDENGA